MQLLIVDDQYSVIQGLRTGIPWKKLGFNQVFYALSALEARMILERNDIDILLCDIEMPMEDGLSLIQWVNTEKLPVKCILLTAHASFEYAKEGLRLGCFDYIVQPASYEEISKTVKGAALAIEAENEKRQINKYGSILSQSSSQMARNMLNNLLNENYSRSQVEALVELGLFPKPEQKLYMGIYQILSWNCIGHWETMLLTDTLDNIGSEIFATFDQKFLISSLDKNCFVFMIWDEGAEMVRDYVEHQLKFWLNVSSQFLKCKSAVYYDGSLHTDQCSLAFLKLDSLKADNITNRSGVFPLKIRKTSEVYQYKNENVRHWGEMLKDGHGESVRKNAMDFLDDLAEKGVLNAEILKRFYLDFLQASYYASQSLGRHLYDLFTTEESSKLYLDGVKSIRQMKQLVDYTIDGFMHFLHHETRQEDIVKKVKEYIDSHLSADIRRDELAEYVFVNPDYLTRVFKKETGMALKEYVIQVKMEEARSLLQTTDLPVGVIAAMVGYYNFSHFSQTYKKVIGIAPSQEERGEE